ncbi:hypothetical protein [Marinimicrobium agarilyticum]|nr:hypothetical protein [Marinimicrobium agarilyticum]
MADEQQLTTGLEINLKDAEEYYLLDISAWRVKNDDKAQRLPYTAE